MDSFPSASLSRSRQHSLLFGELEPGFANFCLTMACRLTVVYPAVIVVSFPLSRIWAILIIVYWLFSGHWKERFALFRRNTFLLLLILYLLFAASGIFYSTTTWWETVREWHGRQTMIVVPVIASLLYQQPQRRAQMFAVFNLAIFIALIVYFFLFFHSDAAWTEFRRQRTFYLFKNSIGTGITLVLWAGLWICRPFASREIPWIRFWCPAVVLESLSAASRLCPWTIVGEVVRRHLPWQTIFFSAVRWGAVLGIAAYLFCLNSSRTAQLALCLSLGVVLLTWNLHRGLLYFLLFVIVFFSLAYALSPFAAKRIDSGIQDLQMMWTAYRSGDIDSLENDPTYRRIADGRLLLYYGLTRKIKEKPLFGYGMGDTEEIVMNSNPNRIRNPHNEYLCIATQSGLIGLSLFLLWIGSIFFLSFGQSTSWRNFGLFLVTVLVVDSLFNCSLSYSSASRFYGILFAALFVADVVVRRRSPCPSFAVIIVAAGKSRRFGADSIKKPFVSLAGRPLWQHSAERFAARTDVRQLIVVVSPEDEQWFREEYAEEIRCLNIDIVCGGVERFESVQRALGIVKTSIDFVAIHDAARPCVSEESIDAVFAAARQHDAAMLATPIIGTVKRADGDRIVETVPRMNLWEAQTPQVFERRLLLDAYAERYGQPTDDAQLVERLEKTVFIVSGDRRNIKITTREDFDMLHLSR